MRVSVIIENVDYQKLLELARQDYRRLPDQAAYYVAAAVRRADRTQGAEAEVVRDAITP